MTDARTPPATPRTLLLATDLSSRCDRALDRAASLAARWDARLIVVNVIEASRRDADDLPSWRRLSDPRAAAEARVRRDLPAALRALHVRVAEGDPADAIIAIAAAEGVDLIVTGVARDEALGRHRLGATVERLARRAPAPVLVVKRRPRPYEEVVVATDFTPASQHALGTVAGLFPDARLTLMHGWEVPFPAFQDNPRFRDDLRAELARHSDAFVAAARIAETRRPALQVLIEHGAPERLIRDYMTDRDIDLAVIGAHSGGAPFEGRLGAVARRILEAAPGDVLIVRELRAERA